MSKNKNELYGCGLPWFPDCIRFGDFYKSCCEHDSDYEAYRDRHKADIRFLKNCLSEIDTTKFHYHKASKAFAYYTIVRVFGSMRYDLRDILKKLV